MKKILAVMLSMGMALSLFGCQSGGTPERPAESSSNTDTEEKSLKRKIQESRSRQTMFRQRNVITSLLCHIMQEIRRMSS